MPLYYLILLAVQDLALGDHQTCGSRDLSLGLETSRDSGIKVLVLELLSLGLGLGTPESWTLVLFLSHTSYNT